MTQGKDNLGLRKEKDFSSTQRDKPCISTICGEPDCNPTTTIASVFLFLKIAQFMK
jgi:hypothetical protein